MAIGTTPGQNGPETHILSEVSGAVAALNFGYAYQVATAAIDRGMRHPGLFNARGLALHAAGKYPEALAEFRRALGYLPNDPAILSAIGLCLMYMEQYAEAIKSFDVALITDQHNARTHYRRGLALAASGEHDAAHACYERAIELDPNYAEALASLASISARKRESDRALAYAERALKLKPGEPTAVCALAILDLGAKRYADAEKRLRDSLSGQTPLHRGQGLTLLADALDGQQRYGEAFAIYRQVNDEIRHRNAGKVADGRVIDTARHLISYFQSTSPERWKSDASNSMPDSLLQHVFLLGFMRSGTTLLEQVLASNPKIVALEEKNLLQEHGDKFMRSVEGLDMLAALEGGNLTRARQEYWGRARKLGVDFRGTVFVDKQPLSTVKLPLIAKLFPRAKVIFALRDPRDVVFSCFRRNFRPNVLVYEFLSLEDCATFYASVMQLAELYRERLPLNVFEHRYEDMVEDFDGRIRALCDFIGVEWAETMREFDQKAPNVDLRSPSATQVRRPLYSEGIGHWRRYAKELAPILPILKPWVEKYGYPPD